MYDLEKRNFIKASHHIIKPTTECFIYEQKIENMEQDYQRQACTNILKRQISDFHQIRLPKGLIETEDEIYLRGFIDGLIASKKINNPVIYYFIKSESDSIYLSIIDLEQ